MNQLPGLATALFAMITKAIPSDPVKLARMKQNQPWAYYHIMKHMALNIGRFLKHHPGVPTDAAVQLFTGDLPQEDQVRMLAVVIGELKKP